MTIPRCCKYSLSLQNDASCTWDVTIDEILWTPSAKRRSELIRLFAYRIAAVNSFLDSGVFLDVLGYADRRLESNLDRLRSFWFEHGDKGRSFRLHSTVKALWYDPGPPIISGRGNFVICAYRLKVSTPTPSVTQVHRFDF
jgi:hypothetical protein